MKRSVNSLTRRQWLKALAAIGTALFAAVIVPSLSALAEQPAMIDIGSRRELFVDDFLIDRLTGAQLTLHKPEPKDVAIVCDAPWEGNTSGYYAIFQDGDVMRMYYRGSHFDEKEKTPHPDFVCYAESKDGIQWTKPNLGLVEFNGSKDNNIVAWKKRGHGSFVPFLDTNPACDPGARYKALTGGRVTVDGKNKGRECLHALQSPDGIHWKIVSEGVITDGAFDSQNLAVWDGVRGEYRAFWRYFTTGHTDERGWKPGGFRAIRTATSKDFVHWLNQEDLKYVDSPNEQLYTNAIQPYFRAPHLFIGFPTRYLGRQVEPLFMTSRDGVLFRRWPEALIPTTAPKDRDGNRSNYMTHGLLQLPGNDRELSVYATEAYYAGPGSRVRRFTFRTDGFVSIHAAGEAELLTKTLQFAGNTLQLNCITRDGGSVGVEIQDVNGKPVPGFALADCQPVSGDNIACTLKWKRGEGVGALAGKPVRLRFVLQNADLYALQFQP